MLYGLECWAMMVVQEHMMSVAEMRNLSWMCSKTRMNSGVDRVHLRKHRIRTKGRRTD